MLKEELGHLGAEHVDASYARDGARDRRRRRDNGDGDGRHSSRDLGGSRSRSRSHHRDRRRRYRHQEPETAPLSVRNVHAVGTVYSPADRVLGSPPSTVAAVDSVSQVGSGSGSNLSGKPKTKLKAGRSDLKAFFAPTSTSAKFVLAAATDAEGSLIAFTSQQATLLKASTALVELDGNKVSKGKLVGCILGRLQLEDREVAGRCLRPAILSANRHGKEYYRRGTCMHEIHRLVSLMKEGGLARYEEDLNEACANFG